MSLPLPHTHPTHYPPFGSSLPNRTWSDGNRGYRFGFNGKEKDSETVNDNFDFGARIFDGRLARWLSLDPLMKNYPKLSPYNFVDNQPINSIDKDGRDIIVLCSKVQSGHPTGHQATLIGNDNDGWKYYSFDGFKSEDNDGKTNGLEFKTLKDFVNSEHNSFQTNYDKFGYADAERDKDGKVIQRYNLGYQITTDKTTDTKMQNASKEFLNTHSYCPSVNDCTDMPRVALEAGSLKTGEINLPESPDLTPKLSPPTTPNYTPVVTVWPEEKQRLIEKLNKGVKLDNQLKRTTTNGNFKRPIIKQELPKHVKHQQDVLVPKVKPPIKLKTKKK